MMRFSLPLFVSRWTVVASIVNLLLLSSCDASYLREITLNTRELQTLPTIDTIIFNDPNLTTFAAAFETAGLVGRLCTTCSFTVFAPDNDAFAAVDQTFLATLLTPSWFLHLQNLVVFHVTLPTAIDTRVLSTDYVDGQDLEMVNFEFVTVGDLKSGITLTSPQTVGSKIIEADTLASNGVIQTVDAVFSPAFFGVDVFALGDSDDEFRILQELMELVGLAGTNGEYTILAPINKAFLDLGNDTLTALKDDKEALGKILSNHVIVGVFPSMSLENGLVLESLGGFNITVTVTEAMARQAAATIAFNDATVILADILARNGIVHAIGTVLMDSDSISDVPNAISSNMPSDAPSSIPSDVPSDMPSDFPTSIGSIFDVGEIDSEFTVLDEFFALTGLDDLEGDYTLLAPVNAAFYAQGNDTLTRLRNNIAVLESLLRNHLIPGTVPPDDLIDGAVFRTLGGSNVTVSSALARSVFVAAQQSTIMFNDATASDIYYAGNGIIYKIDMVLFDPIFPVTSAPLAPTPMDSAPLAPIPLASAPLAPIPSPTNPVDPSETSSPISGAPLAPIPASSSSPVNPPMVVTSIPTGVPVNEPTRDPTVQSFGPSAGPTSQPIPVGDVSASPSSMPMMDPVFCFDFDCGDGYTLFDDAETRPGNDRATCCYNANVCAGAPVGAMCSLADIGSSLIPNPSFEDFLLCPTSITQLNLSSTWVQATEGTSDFFIGSPTCSDSWFRNGTEGLGSIPQIATDGNAFVGAGSLKSFDIYEYVGTCLTEALAIGVEYTFTLNIAAPEADFSFGGDTNGATDLLCVPDCSLFPIDGNDYKGDEFEILSTAEPEGGLVGGGEWKSITFQFVPTVNCPAIMFGLSESHTTQPLQVGTYVIYDFLNLQEGVAGMCNTDGECVPASTVTFCIDFDCGDGYILFSNAEARPGSDRATCCYFAGICAGAPVGAICALGDIGSSLISNPSFEDFSACPSADAQLLFPTGWIKASFYETSQFFVDSPTCNDTWYRNGGLDFEGTATAIGSIPQKASDGNAFVGTYLYSSCYTGYIGTCLKDPLAAGVEYTFTLNIAAAEDDFTFGGDTNGATDLLCVPDCALVPTFGGTTSSSDFEILATAEPDGGLVGGGSWKAMTFSFVPISNCSAIMFGPSDSQTAQDFEDGSYVLYDFLNLQKGSAGVCNVEGACVPKQSSPTATTPSSIPSNNTSSAPSATPSSNPSNKPSSAPSDICIDGDRCDDGNFCTIDCDRGLECENIPVTCGANEACDPSDGSCKNVDRVRPCIAVIDESNNFTDEQINALWKMFRANYPFRPFCLLIPNDPSSNFFFPTDPSFLNDTRAVTAYVNRDEGNATLASNWLDICGFSNLATSGVDYVGLFVDESGSMNRYDVRASLTVLFRDLEAINVTYCTVVNEDENWITPFNTQLGETCQSNSTIDFIDPPTFAPTVSVQPTAMESTFEPSATTVPTKG